MPEYEWTAEMAVHLFLWVSDSQGDKAYKTAIEMTGFAGSRGIPCGYNYRMGFFLPEDDLLRMTPEETKIISLGAEPYPDGQRVRIDIEMTPFQTRPHLDVILSDSEGEEVATANIVEPMSWKLEFTMHLRGEHHGPFSVEATLYYPEGPRAEPVTCNFEVPSAG